MTLFFLTLGKDQFVFFSVKYFGISIETTSHATTITNNKNMFCVIKR